MKQDDTLILIELQKVNGRLDDIENNIDYHIKRTDLIESYIVKNDDMENQRYDNISDVMTWGMGILGLMMIIFQMMNKFTIKSNDK